MKKEEKRKRKAEEKDLRKRIRKEKPFIRITALVAIVGFFVAFFASKNVGISLLSAITVSLFFFWVIPKAIA